MKTILARKVAGEPMTQNVMKKFYEESLQDLDNFTVFFEGGLGAGKTFCVRELLRLCGVTEAVTSPTYTYVQEYSTADKTFAHFDLYRLKNSADFFDKGFLEIAEDESVCKFVEWPLKVDTATQALFSGRQFTVVVNHGVGASMREIKFLDRG